MKSFVLLAGARPNFIKIAPLYAALVDRGCSVYLVHTGQHYDELMSDIFFRDLQIPAPDLNLGIGSGDRITQKRKILNALTPVLVERKPDALVVVGDVMSTFAGAIAGVQAGIPVVHVEAGLRSFNWQMPEELNRVATDHLSSILLVSDPSGLGYLKQESIPSERVHLVGNVMIDTQRQYEALSDKSGVLNALGLAPSSYALVTLHRPETVDQPDVLKVVIDALNQVATRIPLLFPVHPRTREKLLALGVPLHPSFRLLEPQGYLDMMHLTKRARFAITDSGGLQEETTTLGIPCITVRDQTERPVTVTIGTSEVVGRDPQKIIAAVNRVLEGTWKKGGIPELWDGHTAERIVDVLIRS